METVLRHKGWWTAVETDRPQEEVNRAGWEKLNKEALVYMQLSVGDNQIKHIHDMNTAKAAWQALKEAHERNSPGNKIRLLREIVGRVVNEGDNIQVHVDEMTEMFQRRRLVKLSKNFF